MPFSAGFLCEECRRYGEGAPLITMQARGYEHVLTLCTFDCLAAWAIAQNTPAYPTLYQVLGESDAEAGTGES